MISSSSWRSLASVTTWLWTRGPRMQSSTRRINWRSTSMTCPSLIRHTSAIRALSVVISSKRLWTSAPALSSLASKNTCKSSTSRETSLSRSSTCIAHFRTWLSSVRSKRAKPVSRKPLQSRMLPQTPPPRSPRAPPAQPPKYNQTPRLRPQLQRRRKARISLRKRPLETCKTSLMSRLKEPVSTLELLWMTVSLS